jgi:hypothetical protein
MKIVPLAGLLLLAHLHLSYAPEIHKLIIPVSKPIIENPIYTNDYDILIDAIFQYEAGRNPLAYNPLENAVGGLQVRQCRIEHYNQLTGKNYTLNDMYDFNKAKEVFLYFTNHANNGKHITPKSYEQAARNWNGGGPMTIVYWNKIQAILKT